MKKGINILIYAVLTLLFIFLLSLFSGQQKIVEKPINIAKGKTTNEEIAKQLGIKPYNELESELEDLQSKVTDSVHILYFQKNGKTLRIHLVNTDETTLEPKVLTLDEEDSYDFNSQYNNFDLFTKSNINKVILNGDSKWIEKGYTSSNFPKKLGWKKDEFNDFNTKKTTTVSYQSIKDPTKTITSTIHKTKSIHFFLWSTVAYMKAINQDRFYYIITQDKDNKYTASSNELTLDHLEAAVNHRNDSTQRVNDYRNKIKNAQEKVFIFSKNDNTLLLEAANTSIGIPIKKDPTTNLYTVGVINDPKIKKNIENTLQPVFINLKKADASITDWNDNGYNSATFNQVLDLHIKPSRWQEFAALNKTKNLHNFFFEAIAFQLDETKYNTLTLNANTTTFDISSTLATLKNHLLTTIFLLLGLLVAVFLLLRELVPFLRTKRKKEETSTPTDGTNDDKQKEGQQDDENQQKLHDTEKPIDHLKAKEIQHQKQAVAESSKSETSFQSEILKINSLQEVQSLAWQDSIKNELAFLVQHKDTFKKLNNAKSLDGKAFLKTVSDIFKDQETYINIQTEQADLWTEFSNIETDKELKRFLNKNNKTSPVKELRSFLKRGLIYEKFDNATTFSDAMSFLKEQKKFSKEIDAIHKLSTTASHLSIQEIIEKILKKNTDLENGIHKATTVPELLKYVNTWYTPLNDKDSKWKHTIDKIAEKQHEITLASDPSKKLASIEALYAIVAGSQTEALSKLKEKYAEESKKLVIEKDNAIAHVEKDREAKIEEIKQQAAQLQADFEAATEVLKRNNTLAEQYFANFYDPYIKEFLNNASNFNDAELIKRLAFIAFNAIDLAQYVNDTWSAEDRIVGNISHILEKVPFANIPKEAYNANDSSKYLNTIIAFLHKNGVKEIDHLIDGIDINGELKGLN